MNRDHAAMLDELNSLTKNVDHVKTIVAMQQSYAGAAGAGGVGLPGRVGRRRAAAERLLASTSTTSNWFAITPTSPRCGWKSRSCCKSS